MPRDPEMSAWPPEQNDPEPKASRPLVFWLTTTVVLLGWLGIWWLVSWILS